MRDQAKIQRADDQNYFQVSLKQVFQVPLWIYWSSVKIRLGMGSGDITADICTSSWQDWCTSRVIIAKDANPSNATAADSEKLDWFSVSKWAICDNQESSYQVRILIEAIFGVMSFCHLTCYCQVVKGSLTKCFLWDLMQESKSLPIWTFCAFLQFAWKMGTQLKEKTLPWSSGNSNWVPLIPLLPLTLGLSQNCISKWKQT